MLRFITPIKKDFEKKPCDTEQKKTGQKWGKIPLFLNHIVSKRP